MKPIFHLSLMVRDLNESRRFYETMLGAKAGRVTDKWLDLWIFGIQLTIQQTPPNVVVSKPGGKFHIGASLSWDEWLDQRRKLEDMRVAFLGEPRCDDDSGQAKLYFEDPDGYMIELKAYKDVQTQLSPQD